jgi:Tol biopolymer transport system component
MRFGPYEILDLLGSGGMGEVYRARDSKLGRNVAIKVLPASVATDAERRGRFEREARVLASLNHPNIATVYGLEDSPAGHAIVMELVDGVTLADRMAVASEGLPSDEAIRIASQIAEALEAAHGQGIIHRDLKPANIKVRQDGTVKVLDFGLAKALASASDGDLTMTATDTARIVGTPAYMSPEQARGETTGPQTDIWSFGVVLYQMFTGISPFRRATTSETLAAVLNADPDYAKLPAETLQNVRSLIRRSLERACTRRWRHIGDVRIQLDEALAAPAGHLVKDAVTDRPRGRMASAWAAGLFAAATIALIGVLVYPRDPAIASPEARFAVAPPAKGMFLTPLGSGSAAPVGGTVSPDGQMLAFTATDPSGKVMLWIRPLGSLTPTPLPGTEHAALPFWSPNSKSLGFFGLGKLKRVDLAGGAVRVLCDVERGRGGSWNWDDVIIFARGLRGPLHTIRASGEDSESKALTTLGATELSHRFPYFLPDGRRYLYYVEDAQDANSGVFIGDFGNTPGRRLLASDTAAVYASSGHVLFVRQGTLFAQSFDLDARRASGEPLSIATAVPAEGGAPAFSASSTGVLTYTSGPPEQQQFAWFNRSGRMLGTVGPPGNYRGVDLSPDGQRVAVHRHDGAGGDIFVFEPRGSTTRVTHDATRDNSSPIFSPDGNRIAFGSFRNGMWGLYQKSADATEGDELLITSEVPKIPATWAPDGASIVYWLFANGGDSALLRLTGHRGGARGNDEGSAVAPTGRGRSYEGHAQVSPDGKWIAYVSGETGQNEIYVRPFPAGDKVWPVSTAGGVTPRWGRDVKELFYVTSYDNGTLMSVPVRTAGATFVAGVPVTLFNVGMVTPPHSTRINVYHTYAVAPGSQRFLIPRPISQIRGDATPQWITVVTNWTGALTQR